MSSTSTYCSDSMAKHASPPIDLDLSKDLLKLIDERKWYKTENDLKIRRQHVFELESVVQRWVEEEVTKVFPKGKQEEQHVVGYGACIRAFGGQAINVVPTGSDIDALCLLPNFITRCRIFEALGEFLLEHCGIQNMRKVENAFVPIISFEYKGIQIDLSFAVLRKRNLHTLTDQDFVSDDDILRGLEEPSVRSLSGIRDAELLLTLVPDADNFRNALKVVKAWAKIDEMAKDRNFFSETTKIEFQHIPKKQLDDVLSSMDTA